MNRAAVLYKTNNIYIQSQNQNLKEFMVIINKIIAKTNKEKEI